MKTLLMRLRRSWAMLRMYWSTVEGDWSAIALVMQHEIRAQRKHIGQHDFIVGAQRVSRQMLIAETLLGRMLDDAYWDIAKTRYPQTSQVRFRFEYMRQVERQDVEMLTRQMRHLQEWWD